MDVLIDFFLLAILVITAVALYRIRNLFAVVMLAGIYSLVSAGLFVVLDAVDVAFTEAAVGGGVSTIFFLAALALTSTEEKPHKRFPLIPLVVVVITGAALLYGIADIPPYGSPDNPIHHHTVPRYIEEMPHEIGVPNIVTAVLASYRGYDTLGETVVVFTAAVGVLLLIGGRLRRKDKDQ